ncbi:phage holin family protein [Leucobacter komagatae]|uniref:Membrane protein n=1 Tax=Leucobacter komagatae TaxID=55969 RepID=A0A0D0HZU0_9MICO|nr:phage holin family protein [Leucobacter komagatae]KIP53086.1 membrane protein [Leucobacter komagatae]
MRFLFQLISQVVLAAIALVIIHFALPGVSLHLGGFLIALGVFTLAQAVLGPFVLSIARRYAAPLAGGVGLVATLLSLWIASLFNGGIEIHGAQSWLLAPLIVWVVTALGGWLFMALFAERWLKKRETARTIARAKA